MNIKYQIIVIAAIFGWGINSTSLATEDIWADHVVYSWDGTTATYTAGANDNMTHGPFHSSSLWNNPLAILGKPNTLDRDDTVWNPPGGNFREINMVWPAWSKGANDHTLDGTPYMIGYNAGLTSNNDCRLKRTTYNGGTTVGQIVVEFDEVIENDPNNPYGIDFIVHGNPFFATGITVYENSNMDNYTLSAFGGGGEFGASGPGAVFSEPVTVSVAQSLDGPWYTFTSPYKWDSVNHQWTSDELDWTKPVNPWIVNYFGNQTVADAIKLYAGSAGGTPFDLDWLTDENGDPLSLAWVKYIKFSDPDNYQGEICAVARTAPVKLGDLMSVTQEMIELGLAELNFVDADDETQLMVQVNVVSLSDMSQAMQVQTESIDSLADYGNNALTSYLAAYKVNSQLILDEESEANCEADLSLYVGSSYTGDGKDIIVLRWNGNSWEASSETNYEMETKMVTFSTVLDNRSAFVVTSRSLLVEGDASLDGKVDVGDLGILAANYGKTSGKSWTQGDFTGDGKVDVGDLGILAANYGKNASSSDFASDYAKVFGMEEVEESDNSICSSLGLSLIALLVMGTLLIRLEE